MIPPWMLAAAEPVAQPAEDEAPGVVPPEMSNEIPEGLINDDLLEERLLKEM